MELEEHSQTQTLPRSYKVGAKKSDISDQASKSTHLSRTQSTNNVVKNQTNHNSALQSDVNLVLSANSFVSSTMPNCSKQNMKPIRPVLTVQEKLAQDLPSLPPQVIICNLSQLLG